MNWRYFHIAEFACHCGCGQNLMASDFIDKLDELRERCGFPLVINSGYRCPEHNTRVSTTGQSGPHTTGRAADLGVNREKAVIVLEHALQMPFAGIGVNQKGDGRFIHLDCVERPFKTIWSY